ncbi:hypothetical protein DM860_000674 [Cuscuta australis]|uniref:non-specific serine/threonine protein kinase n=1 Tax=Cuscuta australis TaxID=267555 RepID=A0A328CZ68_9ASTE|nr:hypothetical protein DM860_000674 [Cuscuta australis]
MSKMKHLLRKLHIGSGVTDHHHPPHHRPPTPPIDPPPVGESDASLTLGSSSAETTPSSSSAFPRGGPSNSGSDSATDFNFFEEEFQVQLALAISVSDPDSREDPETAQIKAAQQISLGCSPSETSSEFLSRRYWSYNVVNYDEKVMDGFYDVYGFNSNAVVQGKMPLLADLEAISVSEDFNHEAILVNRATDAELLQLEERVSFIFRECQASKKLPLTNILVQRIADLVVDKMGGSVNDTEEISRRWIARSFELRISLNSIILPLGCLNVGLSRHRALLFKVLADRINLPCKLVKGSYYTGTDDGAVNLIKFENGSEYIIDLMGAPGTLIPAEAPNSQFQSHALDMKSVAPISGSSFLSIDAKGGSEGALDKTQSKQVIDDRGNHPLLSNRLYEDSAVCPHISSVQQGFQADNASEYFPNLTQRLQNISLEGSAHISSTGAVVEVGEYQLSEKLVVDTGVYKKRSEHSIVPFTGVHFPGIDTFHGNIKASTGGWSKELENNPSSDASGDKFYMELGNVTGNDCNEKESSMNVTEAASYFPSKSYTLLKEQVDPMLFAVADWEIPWEHLQIGERIGIGSYGEVYRAEWNGTEVAVKKFMNQDITADALEQFKCEVEIMLRLRHPNVVLFMGAVTRPPNLSILTEFLPRGSLYKLLHRSSPIEIDEKRRLRMAFDVAKGMNYLHTSHPIIVHRDLKTPNLLVDKNWVVKVCDFGMSRMKHHTFLSSKSTAGTAEWMAPEVLRNEPSNEKSDVYSFGVILWELATLQVPWSGMNSMQVVGAVGFQGRRLTIPSHVDPMVSEIITNCWNQDPQARPSFAQIITRLKFLQHLSLKIS